MNPLLPFTWQPERPPFSAAAPLPSLFLYERASIHTHQLTNIHFKMQICRDMLAGGRRVRHTPSEEEAEMTRGERIRFPTSPDGYDLLHEIGRGVSAVVYKAACRPLASRLVAVKSIDLERAPAHACALEQVRREAKAMSLLSHPNVLRAHCSFAAGRCLWVVMPLMAAGSMQSILSSSFPGGLPEAAVACVLRDVLRALTYLHGQGHVHRDIKAGNVLVGGDGTVKLADFGVSACIYDGFSSSSSAAAAASSSSSASSASFSLLREMAGTPCWMAPEVIYSHVGYGIKADIWSFGITALELAYGRPPLAHLPPSKSLLARVTSRLWLDDAKRYYKGKKKLSKAFRDMVAACLSQDPSSRPSAEKLLRHPFFKNCRSQGYLVKTILRAVPPLEQRFNETKEINDGGTLTPKTRRVSGWNFCDDGFEKRSVFAKESFDDEEESKHVVEDVARANKAMVPCNTELLVPKLVSLLGSLEKQREMVVDVLESCGGVLDGCEEKVREEREKLMIEFVKLLQKTGDELSLELVREKSKNVELQEELERMVVGRSWEEEEEEEVEDGKEGKE